MSSPAPVETNPQGSWGMDPSNDESNNVRLNDAHESVVHHKNGDPGNITSELEDSPLLPSKTAGGPDLGVPGAKPGTIYREKQIKVLRTVLSHLSALPGRLCSLSCFLIS
jgi:hypothetical protein